MKSLQQKILRLVLTVTLVLAAAVSVYKVWEFYTKSPWTRDARFSADIVAISPDVNGLITDVFVHDNQLVHKGDPLYAVDNHRYKQAVKQAKAEAAYYAAITAEKRREAARRTKLGGTALSHEMVEQALNDSLTSEHQLAKSLAAQHLAEIDLERTVIRAPADGWITNLRVYKGEFINRGSVSVALVKQQSFYVIAYLEETKFQGIKPGMQALITPLGSEHSLYGEVESFAAGVSNLNHLADIKGIAAVDSNLEWVRLAQRIPVRIRLNEEPGNQYPAGTTATVVFNQGDQIIANQSISLTAFFKRLREFG